jgi:hypothetical protein
MKAKYGILDKDIYNFNESSFIIGIILTRVVVTSSKRRGRLKLVQLGNREWTTVV